MGAGSLASAVSEKVVVGCAVEYFALDLMMNAEGACVGVLAMCLEDGTLHRQADRHPPQLFADCEASYISVSLNAKLLPLCVIHTQLWSIFSVSIKSNSVLIQLIPTVCGLRPQKEAASLPAVTYACRCLAFAIVPSLRSIHWLSVS